MSKAFMREEGVESEKDSEGVDQGPLLAKNYMTPAGVRRMREELRQLRNKERPEVVKVVQWAAGNGDRSENGDYIYGKKRLREIDRRIRYLSKRLENVVEVDPLKVNSDQVLFGATVTVSDENGCEKVYSIVGVDEIDLTKNRISWVCPLAKALMHARVGDWITFHSPRGLQEVEVVTLIYQELP